ncbi:hypothetical protein ICQ_03256 [Bacillus toyonensis]|nr:hypothetical protein ICQ_03256 [Bacillus toyonensis]
MMINLDIKDINVKMELNGVFWNEDRIAEMMVTTTAEHSLILHILVDLENKTICAMSECHDSEWVLPSVQTEKGRMQ